jgi:two-component system, NtrC family, sensor histidine kinase PilS
LLSLCIYRYSAWRAPPEEINIHLIDVSNSNQNGRLPLFVSDQATLVQWLKLFVTTFAFVAVVVAQIRDGNFINQELWQAVYGWFILQLSAHLLSILTLDRPRIRDWTMGIASVCDAILICAMVAAFGQASNILLIFFLLNIALTGLYFGLTGAVSIALFSGLTLNFILAGDSDFSALTASTLTGTLFTHHISFLAVAVFSGYLRYEVERVSAELEIKDQDIKTLKDLNTLIIENVGSGLLALDRTLMITQANRASAKIFSDIGLVNKSLHQVLPVLDEKIRREEVRVIDGAVDRFEISHTSFSGDKMILEIIVSPLIRRPYGHQGFVVLIQNLTEVKNLEYSLRQQEKMAAIGAMAAGIAHEIRNPLASISGSVQLLAGSLPQESAEDKKLLGIMIKEIDRLNRLISEFLDFVRPPLKVDDPVSLNILLKEILEMTKLNANLPQNVKVNSELSAHAVISGHYDKLKQAILNIVINAYQALEKSSQGEVSVRTFDDNGKVVLTVSDNGIGMSRDTMTRLFVPFHTTKPRGTGLGLAISHKILEAHEAQISVDSELHKGTTFKIEFKQRAPK